MHGMIVILYIDANNLYGCAKIQALPYGAYEYVIKSLDEILETADDGGIGYFVDEDLEYTKIIEKTLFPSVPRI